MAKTIVPGDWSITQTADRVYTLDPGKFSLSGQRWRWMAMSDCHWDSAHCDLDLLAAHLDLAKKENAPVVIVGDLFDLMQGRWDPRADQDTLRDEHRGNNYLDRVVKTAIEWWKPWAKNLALVIPGNHEGSIYKRHGVDVLDRFCFALRDAGSSVIYGRDWCFLRQRCRREKSVHAIDTFLQHGYGGGGEVTRGLIDHSRTRGQWDADIFISGHIHRRNVDENVMTRLSYKGNLQKETQLFVRCGSYKHEEEDAWHISKGRAARPLGGWWITTEFERNKNDEAWRYFAEAI